MLSSRMNLLMPREMAADHTPIAGSIRQSYRRLSQCRISISILFGGILILVPHRSVFGLTKCSH